MVTPAESLVAPSRAGRTIDVLAVLGALRVRTLALPSESAPRRAASPS